MRVRCFRSHPEWLLSQWHAPVLPPLLQNVVLYAGSAEDRRLIRDYEFYYPQKKVGWHEHTHTLIE